MKNFLRITIVIILLLGIGFGAYTIFFKPANDEAVFIALSEVRSKEEKNKWDEMYEKVEFSVLSKEVTTGEGESAVTETVWFVANPETGKDITFTEEQAKKYNDTLPYYVDRLNGKNRTKTGEIFAKIELKNGNYSLVKNEKGEIEYETLSSNSLTVVGLHDGLNRAFDYYFSYSQAVVKDVPKSELKEIKKLVESYQEEFLNLQISYNSIDSLTFSIKTTQDSGDLSVELEKRYQNTIIQYRKFLSSYAVLVEKVSGFVKDYVFDGRKVIDDKSAVYDIYVEMLNSACQGGYAYPISNDESGILGKAISDIKVSKMWDISRYVEGSTWTSYNTLKLFKGDTITVDSNAVYRRNEYTFIKSLPLTLRTKVNYDKSITCYVCFSDSDLIFPGCGDVGASLNVNDKSLNILGQNLTFGKDNKASLSNILIRRTDRELTFYSSYENGVFSKVAFSYNPKYCRVTSNMVYFGEGKTGAECQNFTAFTLGDSKLYDVVDGKVKEMSIINNWVGVTDTEKADVVYNSESFLANDDVEYVENRTENLSLDFSDFIDCYKNIVELDISHIKTLLNLKLEDMILLKNGDTKLLSTYPIEIQTDVRVVLIALGF